MSAGTSFYLFLLKCCRNDVNNVSAQDTVGSADGVLGEDKEVCFSHCDLNVSLMIFFLAVSKLIKSLLMQDGKINSIGENVNDVASETKAVEPESLVYANKMV